MKKSPITIDSNSGTPIYKQIYAEVKKKIDRAELMENAKLPSIRQLSLRLGINNLTVLKAYNLLERDGYIYKKQGSGVYVKKRELSLYFQPPKEVLESFKEKNGKSMDLIDFVSGTPSNEVMPFEKFKKISIKLLEEKGIEILTYHNTQGYELLRSHLAERLIGHNISVEKEDIQIISGAQQGIDLVLKTLLSQKKNKIVIGRPSYHGAINTFRKDCKIYSVDLQEDGFDLEELEEILKEESITFIYTMMDYESPTGVSWSNEKRQDLLDLAKKYNTYIVVDDCLSDIYFDKPKTSIKALDVENKHVIYIKSFSKVLVPGIRIGYMVIPKELRDNIVSAKFTTDISSSSLSQRIVLEFLETGDFDDHLNNIRKIYSERYTLVMNALKGSKLKVALDIEGGFYLWVRLPEGINGNDFYINCKIHGVSILPGNAFYIDKSDVTHFRLSFAAANEKQIIEGVKRLNKVIDRMMNN